MIEYLRGTCRAIRSGSVVLDVNGVGYGVELPLSSICELRPGQENLELWIYTHVREDAFRLFGFLTFDGRCAFDVLLSVNGVGPKAALAILSTLSMNELRDSLISGNDSAFRSVPGVGPKLAERIVLELKQKVAKLVGFQATPDSPNILTLERQAGSRQGVSMQDPIVNDVRSALENLGFKAKDIDPVLEMLLKQSVEHTLPLLMRRALVELGPQSSRRKAPLSETAGI